MIETIVMITFFWLFISWLSAGLWESPHMNFAETMARTIFWPLVLPILALKFLSVLCGFAMRVGREIPAALGDIWRWK